MTRLLSELPKAHLHLHFTGSMRHRTLQELALEQNIRLPKALAQNAALKVEPTHRGWFRFQRFYDSARQVVRSEEIMRRLLREAAEDDLAEGSVRLELQIDPTSYAPYVGGITPALEIMVDEAEKIQRELSISIGLIVAASRMRHPLDARILARLAAKFAGPVVGFGLSNDERRAITSDFAGAFKIARNAGLMTLPHAGELLGPRHVRDMLKAAKPHRLGHGVRASEDPKLLEELLQQNVALEVCPASNVALGVYDQAGNVPLRTLVEAGLTIALGADDPLLFNSRLVDQYQIARDQGFNDEELAQLARGSIKASLMSDAEKKAAEEKISAWLG